MIFSLDVLRARKGDCMLLHYGTQANPRLMLIDGGPSQVYKPQLKPRLSRIRAARRIGDSEPLPVDVLMVSHIDDDHMNGILELTSELVAAQDARRSAPLQIRSFWYNAFDDIIGNDPARLLAAVTAHFGPASLAGEPDEEGLDPDAAKVLASLGQGIRLRDDARKLKLRLNPPFHGRLVMAAASAPAAELDNGLSLIVAGPMKTELAALQKSYDTFLKEQGTTRRREVVVSFTDTSVPNLSSIVALVAAGGKRMLLTGDARGDKILKGLELAGALKRGGTLHVDVLKMPHHGSDRNMDTSFLRRITADNYIFSGNGEHGNPERATLEMLRVARGDGAPYRVHVTYPIDEIDAARERDWKNEQQKEKARKKKNARVVVRENWSPAANAVARFLAANKEFAKKVTIVGSGTPHVIDLLDPLGF